MKRDMERSQVPEEKKVSAVVCGNTSPQQLTLEELGVPEYEVLKGKVSLRGLWSCVGMAPTVRCSPIYRSDVTQPLLASQSPCALFQLSVLPSPFSQLQDTLHYLPVLSKLISTH